MNDKQYYKTSNHRFNIILIFILKELYFSCEPFGSLLFFSQIKLYPSLYAHQPFDNDELKKHSCKLIPIGNYVICGFPKFDLFQNM